MIWCRFEEAGVPVYGLVEDDWVIPVTGGPFGSWEKSSRRIPVGELRLPTDRVFVGGEGILFLTLQHQGGAKA